MSNETGTAHSVRVSDCDTAPVHVVNCRIDAELIAAVQCLYREGFVELPQADVGNRQPMLLQQLRYCEYGANPISAGPHPATAMPRYRPMGRRFRRAANFSDTMTLAEAPSES
jgi:hypothetical protein